jgi:hypothetical protein
VVAEVLRYLMGTHYNTVAGNGQDISSGRIGTDFNAVVEMEGWYDLLFNRLQGWMCIHAL